MANNSMTPETMLMSGVPVDFPCKPYPCQVAMLGKIIKGLQQSKNCLLESPTGTGKTLTLLCAALAWQQKEIEQARMGPPIEIGELPSGESATKPAPISRIFYCTRTHKQLEQVAKQLSTTVFKDKIRMTLLSSRDNYCVHPLVSKGPNKNSECRKLIRPNRQGQPGQNMPRSECGFHERLRGKTPGDFLRLTGPKQIPRVFDIEQFTEYCQSTHAICPYYTSRLLINDVQIILCPYNYLIDPRVRNSMNMSISNAIIIIDEAHNIEDCARESMKFEMRKYDFELALDEIRTNQKALEMAQIKAAQLIVDASGFSLTQQPFPSATMSLPSQSTPSQQQTMRRSAGYSEFDQLNEEADLLEHLAIDQHGNNHNQEPVPDAAEQCTSSDHEVADALKFLSERLGRALLWFDSKNARDKHTFTGKDLVAEFHKAKFIDRSVINIHKQATKQHPATKRGVIQDASRIRKALAKICSSDVDYLKFSEETGLFLEHFDLCLSIIYADDYQFIDDYKISMKSVPFEPSTNPFAQIQQIPDNPMDMGDNGWLDMSQKSSQFKRYQQNLNTSTYSLHTQQLTFYCLSPSVAFAKDLKLARSLIFASGTLAPLATYSGELKIPFDIQMECNHVIDLHRTFITALANGPNPQVKLRATYQNTDKLDFQDECGSIVLDICQRVPYGVLCFVPSYRFLNLIVNRWMSSGLWQQLNEYKSVFFEEKGSANFQNTINRFREANGTLKSTKVLSAAAKRVNAMWKRKKTADEVSTTTTTSTYFTLKGGLLLAVCRGRASEGIDFSDNNARCVITLGIPYPSLQDEEVIFKRLYNNDQNKRIPEVMNGNDWYDSQAYRALNQALGRCIRHKNDWGALIIVDERIVQNINDRQFNNKISLWIRQRLFVSRAYSDTMNALEKFVANMKINEETTAFEREQQQQQQVASEQTPASSRPELIDDEQRRFSSVIPPLPYTAKKKEETTTTTATVAYRQWKVDDLTDDDDDDHVNENRPENSTQSHRSKAFEEFKARRPLSMPPPPPPSTLPSRTQQIVDLTDDDNDFIERPTSSLTCRPVKKLKST